MCKLSSPLRTQTCVVCSHWQLIVYGISASQLHRKHYICTHTMDSLAASLFSQCMYVPCGKHLISLYHEEVVCFHGVVPTQ